MPKYPCPSCGAECETVVEKATEQLTSDKKTAVEEISALRLEKRQRKEELKALKVEVAALREQVAGKPASEETPAAQGQSSAEVAAKLAALTAENEAMKAEIAGLEEVRQFVAAQKAREAVVAKIDELVKADGNQKLAAFVRPIVEEAAAAVTDPAQVGELYWRVRAENTEGWYASLKRGVPGVGFVNIPQRGGAAAVAGQPAGSAEEQGANVAGAGRPKGVTQAQAQILAMMGRVRPENVRSVN